MKNKNKRALIFFLIFFCISHISQSSENFNFDVTEIEIKENGNKFIGKKKGTATSIDGTKIEANNFTYDKSKNTLTSSGNVEIFDPINNVRIYSDKITYKKRWTNFHKGNSKAIGPIS